MKTLYKFYLVIITFALLLCVTSCDITSEEEERNPRTILVYMVANNSLGSANFDDSDIEEMKLAATTDGFNEGRLLIYHASRSGDAPQLKEITSNGEIIVHKEYGTSVSSVESSRMCQVFDDVMEIAPANDYGLILWSHANGWLQTGIEERPTTPYTAAFGEDAGKQMNVTTLANVLNDYNFSFIYFDCCYMASVEVAYELRNATPYIIASATEIPADGMPYDINLKYLFATTPDLQQACANTFDYYNSRNDETRSCTISLISTEPLDELAQCSKAIYADGVTLPTDYTPQKFMLESRCYLFDFQHYIKAITPNGTLLDNYNEALANAVLYKANTPYMWNSLRLNAHCGLSTFIVNTESDADTKGYKQLKWWHDVVSYKFK